MSIPNYLLRSADRFPGKDAIIQGDRRISYGVLLERARTIACLLLREGIRVGDRVAILMENSPEYIFSYFGILMAGGIVVPFSDQIAARGLVKALSNCNPSAIFVQGNLRGVVKESLEGIGSIRLVVVADEDPSMRKTRSNEPDVVFPAGIRVIFISDIDREEGATSDLPAVQESSVALILYTSGTTGEPKGVMLTHKNLAANAESIIQYLDLTHNDRVMVILPFYYSYGNSLLTTHIAVGGSIVLEKSFLYPNVVLDKMVRENVTGFSGVPSTFAILLNRSGIRKYAFPDLRYITQAGGAMSPKHALELINVLPGAKIFIMYGQTEAAARLSYLEPGDLLRKAGSIGKAIPGVTLTVKKDGTVPAAVGEVGEIVAQGDNIMLGYWNSPVETENVLKADGLHTGDLARMDEDGYLYIVGRKSDMIKSGAHRISPKEIEEAILEFPAVHEVAVVGVEDEYLGEAIVAHVVPKEGWNVTGREIQTHCRGILPPYKVPKTVIIDAELPKTHSGKIKKYALPNPPSKSLYA